MINFFNNKFIVNKIFNIKLIEYPLILFVFYIAHNGLLFFSNINEEVYFNKVIFLGALSDYKFLFLLLTVIIILIFHKIFKISWNGINEEKPVKILILIVAGTLMYKFSTYDFNYYYNSSHYIDRLILIFLYLSLWISPYFLYAFVVYLLVLIRQFELPLGAYSYTDIMPLIDILILFVSFLIIKQFKKIDIKPFIILAVSLHASNYFIPATAKLEISPDLYQWVFYNNISNLFVSSYINGWLNSLSEKTILEIASIINFFNTPLLLFSFMIQFISIFIFFKEKLTFIILVLFEILHIGIFLASGIFFYKWIILNLGFIIFLRQLSSKTKAQLFNIKVAFLFVILVIFSPLYFTPQSLAWYDTKINNYFDVYVTDIDKKSFKLGRNFFSPYDKIFAQNRFLYTLDKPIVTTTYGTIGKENLFYSDKNLKGLFQKKIDNKGERDFDLFNSIENILISDIQNFQKSKGTNQFSIEKSETLKKFLTTYFTNLNNSSKKNYFFEYIGFPYHIYSNNFSNYNNEKINRIDLIYNLTYYNGFEIINLKSEKVLEIFIN